MIAVENKDKLILNYLLSVHVRGIDVNAQTRRWYRGGAYGEDPNTGIADLYDVYEELEYQRELAAQAEAAAAE